jgi:tetratricopeptide (TPR) repeat protein
MKQGRLISLLIVAGAVAAGMTPSIASAADAVTVTGTVVDVDGNPLRGVEVSALPEGGATPVKTHSKKDGHFSLELGDADLVYGFTFTKEGFDPVSTELRPAPEQLSPLEVTMAPAGRTQISEAREQAIPVFNEGVTALEIGDKEAALGLFRDAAEIDPDFPEAVSAAAAIALELENFAVAADAGENLVRLQPDNVDAMGTAYFAELMLVDMERFIPSARRLADANPEVVSDEMVQHARVLFENNEFEGSRSLLEIIIERQPELAEAFFQLGLTCNMLGDSACAKDALERTLELAPEGPDAQTARELLEYIQ